MVNTLCALGYTVDAAGDGPAVFDAPTTTPDAFRLFVSDLDLPRANVPDCLQTLRGRGVPFPGDSYRGHDRPGRILCRGRPRSPGDHGTHLSDAARIVIMRLNSEAPDTDSRVAGFM